MISSSKLELVAACEGSITLPWRDSPNEHSEAGTARHAEDEEAINSGAGIEEYQERWPGLTWRAEVAYVYDISSDTSRYIGCGVNRDYGTLSPFEVPGTIDAEGRGPGQLVIVDRKGFERQEPAERHRQVRFLALAAARHQPAERITVAIRPELGAMDVAEVDPVFDLRQVAHSVRKLVLDSARVRSEAHQGTREPQFTIGRHCRWCPAFNDCPKQKELRALVVRDPEDPDLALQTFVDDDTAADVYQLYKRIGILHKRIGEQLYRHAAVRPIAVGDGVMFGKYDTYGDREYSGQMVHAVASEVLGRDVADQVVEMVASQAQFERVVKPLVAKGKFAATKRSVFDEVERRGGMQRPMRTEIGEYDVGPRLVTDGDSK